jgi:hypothetical protein
MRGLLGLRVMRGALLRPMPRGCSLRLLLVSSCGMGSRLPNGEFPLSLAVLLPPLVRVLAVRRAAGGGKLRAQVTF